MKNSLLLLLFFFTSFLFSQTIEWEQLNGPFGGTALSFASNSNGDVFAGADQDQRGIFRSIDGGLTFQPKSAGLYLDNRACNWLVVDDSSYIIAGTDSHIGSKVYKSKDNGESWTEISLLGGTSVDVNDSGHIYVGNTAYAQYSVSKDGGYTWIHYPSPAAFTNCITINDSGHLFIGGNYTGYRSTDNGMNWTSLGSAGLPDGINSIALAPNGNLFAGCSRENASNSGVYRSTDNGDSWTAVKQGFRVYASHNIVINNNGDIIVGTYGWGIWKSTDNGDTWTQYNSGLGHLYIKAMYIANNGNAYAGLIGGGIYRSTDNGENWAQVGICAALIKKISINPVNENLFAAVYGVSLSTNGGLNWQPANNGLTNFNVNTFAIKTDGTLFIGCAGGGYNPPPNIFRSIDNGGTWVPANTGISQGVHIPSMIVDANGNIYAGTSHDGVYKSTDNGDSWSNIGNPNAGHLVVNSNNDLFIAGNGIWKLSVNDTDWVQVSTASNMYSFFCGSNDYLYAANLRSTDNGETWTEMGLNVWFTSSFAENSLGHLFCGTFNYGSGVWRSTDFGDTWTQINTGLPTMDIRSVAVDSDDYLYAGTNGYSMFKTTTSTVTAIENEKQIPSYFYLEQNYPNPFNPSTRISWQSPVGSHQTLKVYNLLGGEVATLVNEYRPAGTYELTWNAANLPSGIYFYRLQAGSFVETRKMILLK